jgi:1,4-alpha-glucan branching enzyme
MPAVTRLSDLDLHLFNEGSHFRLYEKLGAHLMEGGGKAGCCFTVWAPAAKSVAVVGGFNDWSPRAHKMAPVGKSGLWQTFVPGVKAGDLYKFHIAPKAGGAHDKADPFAFQAELPPRTASKVADLSYTWRDAQWMKGRAARHALDRPLSIYEMHLGSWLRKEGRAHLTYRELAPKLAAHVKKLGFTHVELLPVAEHPFYGSWGYQTTSYFAPTARYGAPADFMAFVDELHREGIGVLVDWVPAHFPADGWALANFDGTHLYEHADPRKGYHPDWHSLIFDFGRPEVRSFLISSALFWLDRYHLDGIRVDAVASMLYLDYSRKEGEWVPNSFGGRENLDAIDFLRRLNRAVYEAFPDVHTIAEESTAWPMVSRPTHLGGLGFGLKWDMGWMHDTLEYMQADPVFRKGQHNQLTFRQLYSTSENFLLPLSHDEVVHGKGSLFSKMPGDAWRKAANLRLLYAWQFAQPGKKLLFMGGEFGQVREWDHESDLTWSLADDPRHRGIQEWFARLNALYRDVPAMHEGDFSGDGFQWIDCRDVDKSVFVLQRRRPAADGGAVVVAAFNFTPVPRDKYRVGVPHAGEWSVALDGDAAEFGGSGYLGARVFATEAVEWHGRPQSIVLDLPPLAAVFLTGEAPPAPVNPAPAPAPPAAATAKPAKEPASAAKPAKPAKKPKAPARRRKPTDPPRS